MNIFQSLLSFKHNPYMVLKPMQMVSSEYRKKHQYMNYFRVFFSARIEFKILLITFKAIHGLAPKYLCDLLTFKSSLYNLRSSDSILLSMPAARSKTLGDRAFMVAAPRLWNSLPKELRAITNVNSFKAHIKTYLFKTLYW